MNLLISIGIVELITTQPNNIPLFIDMGAEIFCVDNTDSPIPEGDEADVPAVQPAIPLVSAAVVSAAVADVHATANDDDDDDDDLDLDSNTPADVWWFL